MVKEPVPGRVKTRLAAGIGAVAAARWFRAQALGLLARVEDPRWETVLAVAPDRAGRASRVWPPHLPRLPQGAGDLGDRMGRIFRSLPPGPALIVGADIPGITRAHVAEGFRALGAADAAIGPAEDGGYWAIGLRRTGAVPATLFRGVRWSTEHARADTVASLGGLRVAEIATLADVDTAADLARVAARAPPPVPHRVP